MNGLTGTKVETNFDPLSLASGTYMVYIFGDLDHIADEYNAQVAFLFTYFGAGVTASDITTDNKTVGAFSSGQKAYYTYRAGLPVSGGTSYNATLNIENGIITNSPNKIWSVGAVYTQGTAVRSTISFRFLNGLWTGEGAFTVFSYLDGYYITSYDTGGISQYASAQSTMSADIAQSRIIERRAYMSEQTLSVDDTASVLFAEDTRRCYLKITNSHPTATIYYSYQDITAMVGVVPPSPMTKIIPPKTWVIFEKTIPIQDIYFRADASANVELEYALYTVVTDETGLLPRTEYYPKINLY